jgi:hypothetical protein
MEATLRSHPAQQSPWYYPNKALGAPVSKSLIDLQELTLDLMPAVVKITVFCEGPLGA